jgi:hypothetical protein
MTPRELADYIRGMPIDIKTTEAPQPPEPPRLHAEDVKAAFDRLGVDIELCPSCGKRARPGVGAGILPIFTSTDSTYPLVVLACPNCGFIRQYDRGTLRVELR